MFFATLVHAAGHDMDDMSMQVFLSISWNSTFVKFISIDQEFHIFLKRDRLYNDSENIPFVIENKNSALKFSSLIIQSEFSKYYQISSSQGYVSC